MEDDRWKNKCKKPRTLSPVNVDMASLIECPSCFEYILPPILQCQSGHLVCSACRRKMNECLICRTRFSRHEIRNSAIEQMASNLKLPCKYAGDGCTALPIYTEKAQHDRTCDFRPFLCPFPMGFCPWQGGQNHIVEHLTISHDVEILCDTVQQVTINVAPMDESCCLVLLKCYFGCYFMVVVAKRRRCHEHQLYFANIQLIGSKKVAKGFSYKFELRQQDEKRLAWEAKVQSIRECIENRDDEGPRIFYGLMFEQSQAIFFANTEGYLQININVFKSATE